MIYDNKHAVKVKGAMMLEIICGQCKSYIATYQKEGKGNILNLYVNRITKSVYDLNEDLNVLACLGCGFELGRKSTSGGEPAFKMIRGSFNRKRI